MDFTLKNLEDLSALAQIISAITTAVYVILTYFTFRQIKKQTDYQQDAYLRLSLGLSNLNANPTDIIINDKSYSSSCLNKKYINNRLHSRLLGTLQPLLPELPVNLLSGNYLVAIIDNYGNSNVSSMMMKVKFEIQIPDRFTKGRSILKTDEDTFTIEIDEIISERNGRLIIPISTISSFPEFKCIIWVSYWDVRKKKYVLNPVQYSGKNSYLN
jgi:hypothetical protein